MKELGTRSEQGFSVEAQRKRLVEARTVVADIYLKVINLGNDASESVWGSPSIKTQLLHQVAHSLLRTQAFRDGGFTTYKYEEVNPENYRRLEGLSARELLEIYQSSTRKLRGLFAGPELEKKVFEQPSGEDISGVDLLVNVLSHEEYHVGQLSVAESYLELGRSELLTKHWGGPLSDAKA